MLWIMWNHCLSNNTDKKDLDKVEVIIGFKITRSKREHFWWNSRSWEDLKEMLLFDRKLASIYYDPSVRTLEVELNKQNMRASLEILR